MVHCNVKGCKLVELFVSLGDDTRSVTGYLRSYLGPTEVDRSLEPPSRDTDILFLSL